MYDVIDVVVTSYLHYCSLQSETVAVKTWQLPWKNILQNWDAITIFRSISIYEIDYFYISIYFYISFYAITITVLWRSFRFCNVICGKNNSNNYGTILQLYWMTSHQYWQWISKAIVTRSSIDQEITQLIFPKKNNPGTFWMHCVL